LRKSEATFAVQNVEQSSNIESLEAKMKQILLPVLVIGILLLSACSAPATTPEAETPPISLPTEQQTYTLTVTISPSETGSVFPSSGQYVPGLQVTLTATPASGYTFDYWDGDTSGSSPATIITMDSDKSVIAYFKTEQPMPPAEPEPTPTPAPKVEVQILEHYLVREDYPPPASFSMTFVRGKVKNISDVTLASLDVTIWVEYQVEGLEDRAFKMPGSIDLEPAAFKPGEVRDFEVLVQNGAKEGYNISVSITPS